MFSLLVTPQIIIMKRTLCLEYFAFPKTTNLNVFLMDRIQTYERIQELLLDNQLSTVRVEGIHCILYSRYYAMNGIVKSSRYDDVYTGDPDDLFHVRRFQLKATKKSFKQISQQFITCQIEDVDSKKITALDLITRDTFKQALKTYLNDKKACNAWLHFEQDIWNTLINNNNSSSLLSYYVSLNLQTIAYSKQCLKKDIRNTL